MVYQILFLELLGCVIKSVGCFSLGCVYSFLTLSLGCVNGFLAFSFGCVDCFLAFSLGCVDCCVNSVACSVDCLASGILSLSGGGVSVSSCLLSLVSNSAFYLFYLDFFNTFGSVGSFVLIATACKTNYCNGSNGEK